ncbi:MAG TPA: hypothetical protein VF395_21050 [Polyangiaceae bacterium]
MGRIALLIVAVCAFESAGYAQGSQAGVEPAAAPSPPPARQSKLVKPGKILFWSGYAASASLGLIVVLLSGGLAEGGHGCVGDVCSDNPWSSSRHYWPLFIPLVGPAWTLAYSDVNDSRGNAFWLGSFLALQVTGATLYVAGKASERADEADSAHRDHFTLAVLPAPRGGFVTARSTF